MGDFDTKPHWFKDHEEGDNRRFTSIDQTLKEMKISDDLWRAQIKEILEPISETYRTVSKMGKWAMATIVFVSVLVGIIVTIKGAFFSK